MICENLVGFSLEFINKEKKTAQDVEEKKRLREKVEEMLNGYNGGNEHTSAGENDVTVCSD